MKKVVLIVVGLLVLFALAAAALFAFVLNVAKAPYAIDESQMQKEYLATKTTLGKLKLMEGLEENPLEIEGFTLAVYTEDGASSEDPSVVSQVVLGTAVEGYQQLVDSVADSGECAVTTEGNVNDTTYYYSECGSMHYYLYKLANNKFIAFQAQGTPDDLKQMINAYVGQ